jgi:hypothetical protein
LGGASATTTTTTIGAHNGVAEAIWRIR